MRYDNKIQDTIRNGWSFSSWLEPIELAECQNFPKCKRYTLKQNRENEFN